MDLLEAIEGRTAGVCVVGLGYVGLPLALRIAECGYRVTGFDTDRARVDHISSTLPDEPGNIEVTTDASALNDADIILVCVPTPIKDDLPDMTHIQEAASAVSAHLRAGQLVVLESTSYPGTTEDLLRTILEESGLAAGKDFLMGFSPERIDPGNTEFTLSNTPKIVGGINPRSTEVMSAFYGSFVKDVVKVSSPAVAEMAKLLENTYRHVNIALSNEMAILCNDLGIDVWEVIDAAGTKPFGFQAFYPGPGWGGHCIPVDPAYLSWRVREMGNTARFVELATEFNQRMPRYVVERMAEALGTAGKQLAGSSVLVVGVSYKPETADCRHSPALEIIARLLDADARVKFHDPHVPAIAIGNLRLYGSELTDEVLEEADLVLLHTGHSALDRHRIAAAAKLIFDARNFFGDAPGNIVKL